MTARHLAELGAERAKVRAGQYGPEHDAEHGTDHLAALTAQRLDVVTRYWRSDDAEAVAEVRRAWVETGQFVLAALELIDGPDDDTRADALQQLEQAAESVNTALAGLEGLTWVEGLHVLKRLRAVTQVLGQLDATVVRHVYLTGEHGKEVHDGIGEVWVGRGRAREKWAAVDAVTSYVEQKLAQLGGEMPDYDTVLEWVAEVVPLTDSTKLRTTPLKAVGLDPADYRTSEPGTLRVDLPRA